MRATVDAPLSAVLRAPSSRAVRRLLLRVWNVWVGLTMTAETVFTIWFVVAVVVFAVGAVLAGVKADDLEDALMNGLGAMLFAIIWPIFAALGPPVLLGKAARKLYQTKKIAIDVRRRSAISREERIERDYEEVVRLIK
jgi:hypothetical protein